MTKIIGLNMTSKSGFDKVFIEVKHKANLKLSNPTQLRAFHLNVDSNEFTYNSLYEYLKKNIGRYVYSRAKIEEYKLTDNMDTIALDAIELLRDADNVNDKGAGGELGEILLYIFLEQVLNAPKMLSKIELKTTNNQYVFGCDGIHMLKLQDTYNGKVYEYYQLILGEAKIIGDIKSAVKDALGSINKFNNNHDVDLKLLDTNMFKEAFDEKTVEFLKSLIIPSKRNNDISVDRAFGIFIGYEFNMKDKDNYSNVIYKEKVNEKVAADIEEILPEIEKLIYSYELQNHSFYFYFLPFNDAKKDRAAIINKLKGVKVG